MKHNNKRKGFTLVELLVVISIITILSSVSVIGYLGFTKKANDSKALTEIKQYQTLVMGQLVDGEEQFQNHTIKHDILANNHHITLKATVADAKQIYHDFIIQNFEIEGSTIEIIIRNDTYKPTSNTTQRVLERVVYTTSSGSSYTWTIASNTIQ